MPRGNVTIYQDGSWGVSVSGEKGEPIAESVLEIIRTSQEAWKTDKKEVNQ